VSANDPGRKGRNADRPTPNENAIIIQQKIPVDSESSVHIQLKDATFYIACKQIQLIIANSNKLSQQIEPSIDCYLQTAANALPKTKLFRVFNGDHKAIMM